MLLKNFISGNILVPTVSKTVCSAQSCSKHVQASRRVGMIQILYSSLAWRGSTQWALLLIIIAGDTATCYEIEVQEAQYEVKEVFKS